MNYLVGMLAFSVTVRRADRVAILDAGQVEVCERAGRKFHNVGLTQTIHPVNRVAVGGSDRIPANLDD